MKISVFSSFVRGYKSSSLSLSFSSLFKSLDGLFILSFSWSDSLCSASWFDSVSESILLNVWSVKSSSSSEVSLSSSSLEIFLVFFDFFNCLFESIISFLLLLGSINKSFVLFNSISCTFGS